MNEMTVHIWAEHTALFGRTVAVQNLDQYDGDPADCGDWVQYTGTAAEFDAQHLPKPYRCRAARLRLRLGVHPSALPGTRLRRPGTRLSRVRTVRRPLHL